MVVAAAAAVAFPLAFDTGFMLIMSIFLYYGHDILCCPCV